MTKAKMPRLFDCITHCHTWLLDYNGAYVTASYLSEFHSAADGNTVSHGVDSGVIYAIACRL